MLDTQTHLIEEKKAPAAIGQASKSEVFTNNKGFGPKGACNPQKKVPAAIGQASKNEALRKNKNWTHKRIYRR